MLLKELKNAKGAIINFLFLAFYLIYFGRAEIGSSKTAYLIVGVFAILAFFVNQFVRFKSGDTKPRGKRQRCRNPDCIWHLGNQCAGDDFV